MKFSESWLREWVNPEWDSNKLAEELSLAGLEVDGVEPVAPAFNGVLVGEVLSVEKHPYADKLNVTQVNVGDEQPLQIVCGAKNVAVGMKVCCATVGAVLPGDSKIKKAKLRGVSSHGMLCGATEIGLPDDGVDGLYVLPTDAPVGEDVREYLELNDVVIDVDLTPNRADCFSIQGIARDVAAISGAEFRQPFEDVVVAKQGTCSQQIKVENSQACPQYLGCLVEDFDLSAETPQWITKRLERSGISPKALAVDITNYVLLELGQPMHAFDADKLNGSIEVRMAVMGERFTSLEEKELVLDADTLVIADSKGPVALAGVMGGLHSAVSEQTSRIFFECASFDRLAIAGKARKYGLHTDSSIRFERGVDMFLPEKALERALALFTEIAGGTVSEISAVVNGSSLYKPNTILLRPERISKLLGVEIAAEQIEAIFKRLNFDFEKNAEGWLMSPPSYRYDMEIEADLIEEVGRIFGYNNLPETEVNAPMRLPALPESEQELHMIRNALVNRGYHEVITYSFVNEDFQKKLTPELPYVCLQNPISDDMKAMRTSLLPGLLNTVAYNQNRQQNRIRIFETGLVFLNFEGEVDHLQQIPVIGGVITGDAIPAGWNEAKRPVDFFDLKGHVETLLGMSHVLDRVRFEPHQYGAFHPGQSAAIVMDNRTIGFLGQLHPGLVKTADVSGKIFIFEMRLDAIGTMAIPTAASVSKFPEVQRDLSFVMAVGTSTQKLIDAIHEVDSEIMQRVEVFDIYQGQGVEDGKKSVALALTIQHMHRTLQDEEVDQLIEMVIDSAKRKVAAELR